MSISKKHKIFNLVISPSQSVEQLLIEEFTKNSKQEPNLFKKQTLQKKNVMTFKENRPFDYVGIKQLKGYYERARRLSKQSKRMTGSSNFAFNRASMNSRIKESSDLMTRIQLLQMKKGEHVQERNLARHSLKSKVFQDLSSLNCSTLVQSRLNTSHVQNISLLKIKKNYKQYTQNWDKLQKIWQQKKGFPSVIKAITEERQKRQTKQNRSLQYLKDNINSRMWQKVLREESELKNIYNKIEQTNSKVSKHSLNLRGKNKLQSETNWINQKGDQGYRFKVICTDIVKI